MYTYQKDHLAWQQTVGLEDKRRTHFNHRHSLKIYDFQGREDYMKNLDEVKMKQFYGKHLFKYMGDTIPAVNDSTMGVGGVYAPLQMTAFRSQEGFYPNKQGGYRSLSLKPNQVTIRQEDKHMTKVLGENKKLQEKLGRLQERLKMAEHTTDLKPHHPGH